MKEEPTLVIETSSGDFTIGLEDVFDSIYGPNYSDIDEVHEVWVYE